MHKLAGTNIFNEIDNYKSFNGTKYLPHLTRLPIGSIYSHPKYNSKAPWGVRL